MRKSELSREDMNFLKNMAYYESVLFADEDYHLDAMFKFIQLKLRRTLIHWEEGAPYEMYGWEEELTKIKRASHYADKIVSHFENGGQPSDVDVVMLFTSLMEAHKWWGVI